MMFYVRVNPGVCTYRRTSRMSGNQNV